MFAAGRAGVPRSPRLAWPIAAAALALLAAGEGLALVRRTPPQVIERLVVVREAETEPVPTPNPTIATTPDRPRSIRPPRTSTPLTPYQRLGRQTRPVRPRRPAAASASRLRRGRAARCITLRRRPPPRRNRPHPQPRRPHMNRWKTGMLAGLLALLAAISASNAQVPAPPKPEPITLTIHPAPEPVPALKYRLEPERRKLIPGNAALFYHRAIQKVIENRVQQQPAQPNDPESSPEMIIANWASGPINDIDRDKARELLQVFDTALHEIELGSQRTTCDWELDQRPEGINLLLGEVQESRSLARLVAVKARLAILDGDTDAAMHWIQVGMTLGRHVAMGPTIIQALVGIAIDSVMARCLQDLMEQPGTPSFYWALADRPRPMIDMRRPLESERYLLEKELPELAELDRGVWSIDEAQRFADELQSKLFTMVNGGEYGGPGDTGLPAFGRRLGIAAMAAKIYPEAKSGLIAMGRPAERRRAHADHPGLRALYHPGIPTQPR